MRRHGYARPPIVEALLDIQVSFERVPEFAEIERLGTSEERQYPTREPLRTFSMVLDTEQGQSVSTSQDLIGYRYWSANRESVFQLRSNGFLFSKLPPYSSWEDWRDEAKRIWHNYVEQLRPARVARLGVRYINRIELPAGSIDLSDYFRVRPEIPAESALVLRQHLMRIEANLPNIDDGFVTIGQGSTAPVTPDTQPLLLDLDLFQNVDLAPDDEGLWLRLQALHDRENELFEDCITTQTRELFS